MTTIHINAFGYRFPSLNQQDEREGKERCFIKGKIIQSQDAFEFFNIDPMLQLRLMINEEPIQNSFIDQFRKINMNAEKDIYAIILKNVQFEYTVSFDFLKSLNICNYFEPDDVESYFVDTGSLFYMICDFNNKATEHSKTILANFGDALCETLNLLTNNQDSRINQEQILKLQKNHNVSVNIFSNAVDKKMQVIQLNDFFKQFKTISKQDNPLSVKLKCVSPASQIKHFEVSRKLSKIKQLERILSVKFEDYKIWFNENFDNTVDEINQAKKKTKNDFSKIIDTDYKELDIAIGKAFKYTQIYEKISDIEYLNKNGIGFLDRNEPLDLFENSLLFCYDYQIKRANFDEWTKYFGKVVNLKATNNDIHVYVYDFDIRDYKTELNITNRNICTFIYLKNKFISMKFNENYFQLIDRLSLEEFEQTRHEIKNKPNNLNILLFGESGVGKSTFVNAFYNYVTFGSLEEAEAHDDVLHKIPLSFTFLDDDYQKIQVKVGKDSKNERMENGESSTLKAQEYSFKFDDKIVNIVDTPGMSDTRGIDFDKDNFRESIQYLSKYEYLNAICVLIKPNNSRFTPAFKYCFKELLSGLHKDVVQNILFCFTNTSTTSYRPGQSLSTLESFLDEIKQISNVSIPLDRNNIFCFDNEAFRYLAIRKNDYPLNVDGKSYKSSWDRSCQETKRMLRQLSDLPFLEISNLIMVNKLLEMEWAEDSVSIIKKLYTRKIKDSTDNDDHSDVEEYDSYIDDILSLCSKLSGFIAKNLQSVFNDKFDSSLEECIEGTRKRRSPDKGLIDSLVDIRKKYKNEMKTSKGFIQSESEYERLAKKLMKKIDKAKKLC